MRSIVVKTLVVVITVLTAHGLGAANLLVTTDAGIGPGTGAPGSPCASGCGLEVNLTGDTNKAYLVSSHPSSERVFTVEFWYHPNNTLGPNKTSVVLLEARKGAPNAQVLMKVSAVFKDDRVKLRAFLQDDSGATIRAGQFDLNPTKKVPLRLEWQTASGASANDGSLSMTNLSNNKTKSVTGVDNYLGGSNGIDEVRFGYAKSGHLSTVGSFFLDDYSSSRL